MPLNSVVLSNAARLRIANLFADVSSLPVPGVEAIVYSYASTAERTPNVLATRRAEVVIQYLSQLGVAPSLMHVQSEVVTHAKGGEAGLNQIEMQFAPMCPPKGCGFLCNVPTNENED